MRTPVPIRNLPDGSIPRWKGFMLWYSMTQSEGFALAQFINDNSSRFLAMAFELPDECHVLVVDGANRNSKGYGFAFEPVIDIEKYLLETHDLPEEYAFLLTRWHRLHYGHNAHYERNAYRGCSVHHAQKAETNQPALRVASLPTLSSWQRSMLEYSYKSRRSTREVCASAQSIRENTRMVREEARERLAHIKEEMQHSRNHSSVVLAGSSRSLQEINMVLATKDVLRHSQEHEQHPDLASPTIPVPLAFPEVGRRRCSTQ
jgi:hypothetical protein